MELLKYKTTPFRWYSPSEENPRNGKRLKPGETRPDPFWMGHVDKILPVYKESITNYNETIMNFRICGAYSRHYDKPRKFRKERLF